MIDATSGDVVKFEDENHFMDLGSIISNKVSDGYDRPRKKRQKKMRH
jgi:hypothetical protein